MPFRGCLYRGHKRCVDRRGAANRLSSANERHCAGPLISSLILNILGWTANDCQDRATAGCGSDWQVALGEKTQLNLRRRWMDCHLLLNVAVGDGTWAENAMTDEQIIERYGLTIAGGSNSLCEAVRKLIRRQFSESMRT